MAGKSVKTSIFQIFGAHSHWHALILAFKSKVLFYYEPYGTTLQSPQSPIMRQFKRHLEPHGWTLTSLRVRLQSDGHSCGIWVQEMASVWLQFVQHDPTQLSNFETFLRKQLRKLNVYDLHLERDKQAAVSAKASNISYIRKRRDALREELEAAATNQNLAWWQGSESGQ